MLSLFSDGLFWHPQNEAPIPIKKNPLEDLDKYLSSYLDQINSGAIEVLQDDPKLPTLLHFAVKNDMKKLIQTLLTHPGGVQMATMTNSDGLNAREMAVHAGNLELAKLLKDPKMPRQNYEYPVLKSQPNEPEKVTEERQRYEFLPSSSQNPITHRQSTNDLNETFVKSNGDIFNNSMNQDYIYDIPRKVEQWYVVPPAPRPVDPKLKLKYVSMHKPSPEVPKVKSSLSSPQSRQELLESLRKDSPHEDLPEPSQDASAPYVNIDEPKSPLDIVKPFPMIVVQNDQKNSPEDRLRSEFTQVQTQLITGQINLAEAEVKYEEWKSSLLYTLASDLSRAETEALTKKFEEMIETTRRNEKECSEEKSFRKKFRKLMKSSSKEAKKKTDAKYSTLPSMPLGLKKPRTVSASNFPTSPSYEIPPPRNKSSSVSENSRHSDSESSSTNSSFDLVKHHSYDNNNVISSD